MCIFLPNKARIHFPSSILRNNNCCKWQKIKKEIPTIKRRFPRIELHNRFAIRFLSNKLYEYKIINYCIRIFAPSIVCLRCRYPSIVLQVPMYVVSRINKGKIVYLRTFVDVRLTHEKDKCLLKKYFNDNGNWLHCARSSNVFLKISLIKWETKISPMSRKINLSKWDRKWLPARKYFSSHWYFLFRVVTKKENFPDWSFQQNEKSVHGQLKSK